MISLQKAQWIFLKPKGAWKARCPERCLQRGLLAYYSVDVKTVSGMLGHFVFWARTWVNRYSRPLTRTISHQIAKKSPEILRFQDFVGIPTTHRYNAPCFESVVHILLVPFWFAGMMGTERAKCGMLSQKSSLCRAGSFLSADYIRDVSCKCAKAMRKNARVRLFLFCRAILGSCAFSIQRQLPRVF